MIHASSLYTFNAIYVHTSKLIICILLTHTRELFAVERFNDFGDQFLFSLWYCRRVDQQGRGSLFAFHVRVARYHLWRFYRIVSETECVRISGSVVFTRRGLCEMSCSAPGWLRLTVRVQWGAVVCTSERGSVRPRLARCAEVARAARPWPATCL